MQQDLEILGERLAAKRWKLATAESCTGGLIAARITDTPGASQWYAGSVVAYSNNVKLSLLGVAGDVLSRLGAVSEEVVEAMAAKVMTTIGAHISVAVSGIAGPDGGTEDKPVGTVWMAWASPEKTATELFQFEGDREQVREQAVEAAIRGLLDLIR